MRTAQAAPAKLQKHIRMSPYVFFRFTNRAFARAVCEALPRFEHPVPQVDLHGDAHLEQLSVVAADYGLIDFDDATRGPVLLDLVRLIASAQVAGNERHDAAAGRAGSRAALKGYRERLAGKPRPPTPAAVQDMIDGSSARAKFADSVFAGGVGPHQELTEKIGAGWKRYVDAITAHNHTPRWQFGVVEWYVLSGHGVGSNRTPRFLIRIAGPTESADDDVVLEAKQLADLRDVPCIDSTPLRVVRVLGGFAKFAPYQDPFAAQVPRAANEDPNMPPWWVHSWRPDFAEVDLSGAAKRPQDLEELSRTTGWLLADGHLRGLQQPAQDEVVRQLDVLTSADAAAIFALADELAGAIASAHDTFTAATAE